MLRKNLLTCDEIPSAEDLVAYNFISDPLSVWCYEISSSVIVKNKDFWPRDVGVIRKKPAVVENVCTSPLFIRFNTITGRGQKEDIFCGTVFYLYRLKFVLVFSENRQAIFCFCCQNSIKIQPDRVVWMNAKNGYQSY